MVPEYSFHRMINTCVKETEEIPQESFNQACNLPQYLSRYDSGIAIKLTEEMIIVWVVIKLELPPPQAGETCWFPLLTDSHWWVNKEAISQCWSRLSGVPNKVNGGLPLGQALLHNKLGSFVDRRLQFICKCVNIAMYILWPDLTLALREWLFWQMQISAFQFYPSAESMIVGKWLQKVSTWFSSWTAEWSHFEKVESI